VRFTHTVEMDWMLPGIAPTGKRVEVALDVIVHFRDGKLAHEHIYWDQASVLAQLGPIDAATLPVCADTARKALDPSLSADALIRVVKTETRPSAVVLWQATNPVARDFRLEAIGPAYRHSALEANGDGKYVAKVPEPARGWTAYFVELTFASGSRLPLKFTTAVRVIPDRLPFGRPPELYRPFGCSRSPAATYDGGLGERPAPRAGSTDRIYTTGLPGAL
jgi:hypothetical protein